jgi:hypothetical protein
MINDWTNTHIFNFDRALFDRQDVFRECRVICGVIFNKDSRQRLSLSSTPDFDSDRI